VFKLLCDLTTACPLPPRHGVSSGCRRRPLLSYLGSSCRCVE